MSRKTIIAPCMALLLSGCLMQPGNIEANDPSEHIRAEFSQCRAQALKMDASAREHQSVAQYHTAANLFGRCVERYSTYTTVVSADEMLEIQALSILGFIKAGDLQSAEEQLQLMRDAFPEHDLYFSDGSSFVDSIYLLLDTAPTASNDRRLLNVNPIVSAERQRRDYWLQY
mgnify:CR=1 FL=1